MHVRTVLGALGLATFCLAATADDARACGGCFHGSSQSGSVITDHRMIFRVSPQQTTLYDEIEYQGNPASFAWVLPIHGKVAVGLSSDILFASLESATQTTIQSPILPACPSCSCGNSFGAGGSSSGSSSGGGGGGPPVNVISQSTVGPYDTVQLQSTDPNALNAWLGANGFVIPADVQPIIAAYVNEGFDFLALRLAPGQGVQAMRPVSVTAPGAALSLPLRMVSAGTGATVGITLWVVGDGRYAPTNFQTFTLAGSDLTWDWSTNASDYTTLRAQKEAALGNAAWQIESSLELSPYQIEDAVLSNPAEQDYLAIPASDAGAEGGAGQTADQVRQADLATLFPNSQASVRITRMRSDLSHAALATDLVLGATSDQSVMSNRYQVARSANAPQCAPVPNPCPPCDSSSSSGSSSGYLGGTGSGGATTRSAAPGSQSFSCAATSAEPDGVPWTELVAAGLVGLALIRSRLRRRP
jgi:MYXO-CTERM domain-containing protein